MLVQDTPNYYIVASCIPAFICIKFIGIKPMKVAIANVYIGTPTIGLAMLMNQLGTRGVILRNPM